MQDAAFDIDVIEAGRGWLAWARLVLLGTLLLAPFAFGAVQPWAWAAIVVLAGVAYLFWALGTASRLPAPAEWSPIYIPLVLLMALLALQRLAGGVADPVGARESSIKFAAYVGIFFLAGQLLAQASETAWETVGVLVTTYGFAISLFAVIQLFSSPGAIYGVVAPEQGGYVFGPFVNHNHYAGLLELVVPISFAYLVGTRRNRNIRPLLIFAVILSIASVLLSGSRGGMIAILGEFIAFGTILLLLAGSRAQRGAVFVAGLICCSLVVGIFLWLDAGRVRKRIEAAAKSPEVEAATRTNLARDAMRMLRDHPLLGSGAGSFALLYPRYQSFASDYVFDHAHNDYAEALAETGAAGGVLIAVTLILFFRAALHGLSRLHTSRGWLATGAVVGCFGLLIHSFSDFNLHIPANAACFAAAAGMAIAPTLGGPRS